MSRNYFYATVISLLFMGACAHAPANMSNASISKSADSTYKVSQKLSDFTDFILVKTNTLNVDAKSQTPQLVSLDSALDDLSNYDVVFVGEVHGHVANHILQTKILSGLYTRNSNLALSMEQFERDAQARLDQYLSGDIGESVLTKDGVGWSHYKQSYRPMVEFAKKYKFDVIAANAPGKAVRCIGMNGAEFLDTLTGEKRKWLAQTLHMQDGPYKDKYYELMGAGMGHGPQSDSAKADKERKLRNSFAGQVARDDTMAESIFMYLQAHPQHKIMHTNGNFHSAALLGTPERLAQRNPNLKLANIHPVMVENPDQPSFSAQDLAQGQYIALIFPAPEQYVKQENMMAFFAKTGKKMKTRICKY